MRQGHVTSVPQIPADIVSECLCILAKDSAAWVQKPDNDARQESFRDLCSCSLVCKLWRDACGPIKWRNLSLTIQCSWIAPPPENHVGYTRLSQAAWVDGKPPPEEPREVKTIHSIIEFLKDRPDVAKYVRALGLDVDLQNGTILPGFAHLEASVVSELLECLPFIQDLHLRNIAIRLETGAVPTAFSFPKLRQFSYTFRETIAGGPLQETEDLLTPLRLFTEIDQLCLVRRVILIRERPVVHDHPFELGHTRCRVRSVSLDVEMGWMPKLLEGLRRLLEPTSLHTLELTPITFHGAVPILRDFAPSLKRLSLNIAAPSQAGQQLLAAIMHLGQGNLDIGLEGNVADLGPVQGNNNANNNDEGEDDNLDGTAAVADEDNIGALPGAGDEGEDNSTSDNGLLLGSIVAAFMPDIPPMPSLEHLSISFADIPVLRPPIRGQLFSLLMIGMLGCFTPKAPSLRHVNLTAAQWDDNFAAMSGLLRRLHTKMELALHRGPQFKSLTFTEGSDTDQPIEPATIAVMQKLHPRLHARGMVHMFEYERRSCTERLRVECEQTTRALSEDVRE